MSFFFWILYILPEPLINTIWLYRVSEVTDLCLLCFILNFILIVASIWHWWWSLEWWKFPSRIISRYDIIIGWPISSDLKLEIIHVICYSLTSWYKTLLITLWLYLLSDTKWFMDFKVILYARLFYLLLPIFGSFNTDYSFNLVITPPGSLQKIYLDRIKLRPRYNGRFGKVSLMRFCYYKESAWTSISFSFQLHNLLPSLPKLTTLQYPSLEPLLDDLLPKKSPMIVVKWLVVFLSCSACLLTIHYVFLYIILLTWNCIWHFFLTILPSEE